MDVRRVALVAAFSLILPAAVLLAPGCGRRDVYLVPGRQPLSEAGPPIRTLDATPPPPDGMPPIQARDRDTGVSPDCVTESYPRVAQPLGVYMMVDRSGSMQSTWTPVVNALKSFVDQSSALSDVSIGVQYFPVAPSEPDWAATACTPAPYITPDVSIALLPGNRDQIFVSLDTHSPNLLSIPGLGLEAPTDAALTGAIQGARNWSDVRRDENPKSVVLLVTDGVPDFLPSMCISLDRSRAAAEEGFIGNPSVPTYVFGVGGQLGPLDDIAASGGTGQAYVVSPDAPESEILAELQRIRDVALPCELEVEHVDQLLSGRVNLQLSGQDFLRVASAGACGTAADAREWYVSEESDAAAGPDAAPSAPRVKLCPSTCQAVRSGPGNALYLVYGCPTALAE